jgi:copper chaperone CopZ
LIKKFHKILRYKSFQKGVGCFSVFLLILFAQGVHASNSVHLKVKGMTCSSCAQIIETQLKTEAGVEGVAIKVLEGDVVVSLKDGHYVSDEQLRTLIEGAGYQLKTIERN